jgi:hypothetical protein
MEKKSVLYLILLFVLIFVLFSNKLTENFNSALTIDEFNFIIQSLKPNIGELHNEINSADINKIIAIFKESQNKPIESRSTHFDNATAQIKIKGIELKDLYWELRTLITDNDMEISKSIHDYIITEGLIKRINELKLFPENISVKLQNRVPRQLISFIVKHYDPINKSLEVKFEDFLEKIQNNPSFLE